MLILSGNNIKQAVSIPDVLKAIEDAFLIQEKGEFVMPDRMYIEHDGNTLLLMPAISGDYFSTKLVTVFPKNIRKNEPVIYGSVILNDGTTGKPIALLDGSILTALRTGAVGGLGVTYTTPGDVSSIGLIGAGFQGFYQLLFACTVRNVKTVNLFDFFKKDMNGFVVELKEYLPHIQFNVRENAEDVVRNSEVIIAATTSATPVMPDDIGLLTGRHFIGLGSFKTEMQEFPEALYRLTEKVIIDTPLAKKESGDISIPLQKGLIDESNIFTLGKIINKEVNLDVTKTTFFKSVGMALFDLLAAKMIYEKAKERGIGTEVDF